MELEQISTRNRTPATQILVYTRQGKLWSKGEPLADEPIALNQVSMHPHSFEILKFPTFKKPFDTNIFDYH